MSKRLLITGASGFLGWNLCQVAQENWEVHGTFCQHPIELAGATLHALDLTDTEMVKELIDRVRPDGIIHAAAASSPNFCQSHPDLSYRINVIASQRLAEICRSANVPFVFTSTDLVFDGKNPPYKETDTPCPINLYGEHKLAAEIAISNTYPQATICRMPLMFGMAPPTATSFIQPWLKALTSGEPLQLFVDEFRTPASAIAASKGLLIALNRPGEVLNLGGKERISRYDFGIILAEVFRCDRNLISPLHQSDIVMAAPRAADVSLDSSKAFSLGYDPLSIRAELTALASTILWDDR